MTSVQLSEQNNSMQQKSGDKKTKQHRGNEGVDAYSNSAFVIRFCLVANVIILEAVVLQLNSQAVLRGRDG
jgi:hypothetical protein